MLIQITSPVFCAGAILRDGVVIFCAPILRRDIMGLSRQALRELAKRKGWTIKIIEFDNEQERT